MWLSNTANLIVILLIAKTIDITIGQNQCGISFNAPNSRIVGGQTANVLKIKNLTKQSYKFLISYYSFEIKTFGRQGF